MPIDAHTRLVTLIGYPVTHSLSPLIHNTAFAAQGLNWRYVVTQVRPGDLQEAIYGLRALNFAGANVTIPHKVDVMPWLDEVSERARQVGAVNTITVVEGEGTRRLLGDNTDVAGFLAPLAPYHDEVGTAQVLIFGSGGAARAVVYGLLTEVKPKRVTIAARSLAKAEQLALDMATFDQEATLDVVSLDDAASHVRNSRLLVNATPVGMEPDQDRSPWPETEDISPESIVYDLVYAPPHTRLLSDAERRGARTIGGIDMLIAQAAEGYRQWTEQAMPLDVVRDAVLDEVTSFQNTAS